MAFRILALALAGFCCFSSQLTIAAQTTSDQPNILWITSEDHSPDIGCYGDSVARTPHLDAFASQSMLYKAAWSNAPVCAPARTTIITGVYPTSMGAQHMRSLVKIPRLIKALPVYMKEAGYYCTNNVKTDYNVDLPKGIWDESSKNAHWKNRPADKPFFAVFNFTGTHESQIRNPKYKPVTDPATIKLPAFHPDTPEVRRDWAEYYDRLNDLDGFFHKKLTELKEAGLEENTIVFFFSDHGSGMPGYKRSAKNTGLQVPFVVHFPEKFKHLASNEYAAGAQSDRLISFVDLVPTMLSITGQEIPEYLQGKAFLGPKAVEPQPYVFGFRGRMDERYDMVRSVRDQRFVYVHNYYPHLAEIQPVEYQFQTPTTVVWKRLYDEGKLNEAQASRWIQRLPEELYDLENDPDEVHNLIDDPQYDEVVRRFRKANWDHLLAIKDVGFLPESMMLARSEGSTPYEMGHDPMKYPMMYYLPLCETAIHYEDTTPEVLALMDAAVNSEDACQRFWGLIGMLQRGEKIMQPRLTKIGQLVNDETPIVAMLASYMVLTQQPEDQAAWKKLGSQIHIDQSGMANAIEALFLIDNLPAIPDDLKAQIKAVDVPEEMKRADVHGRYESVYQKLQAHIDGVPHREY
jgi:arylsulfatase A-like enzyme